jgi:hypothetical protein
MNELNKKLVDVLEDFNEKFYTFLYDYEKKSYEQMVQSLENSSTVLSEAVTLYTTIVTIRQKYDELMCVSNQKRAEIYMS